ncbi:MAG: hypothetical protein VB855_10355, partial [Pirellulaceae bacterium]
MFPLSISIVAIVLHQEIVVITGLAYSRRAVLQSSIGLTGLTLSTLFQLRAEAALAPRAKACIVIY